MTQAKNQSQTNVFSYDLSDYKWNVEYGTDILDPPITWNNWVEICKITKWCYVENLLPKGGEK